MEITPIPYPKNVKRHPQDQLYKLAISIRDFGWQQPIVVDTKNVIIVGHGRWAAYLEYQGEMNLPEPWIKVAELPDDKAEAYRLFDNLSSSQDYDAELLAQSIDQMALPFQELMIFGETKKDGKVEQTKINDEAYLKYLNQTIRQIVMHYSQQEYDVLMVKQEDLKAKYGLETASELYQKLVNEAHERDIPRA